MQCWDKSFCRGDDVGAGQAVGLDVLELDMKRVLGVGLLEGGWMCTVQWVPGHPR